MDGPCVNLMVATWWAVLTAYFRKLRRILLFSKIIIEINSPAVSKPARERLQFFYTNVHPLGTLQAMKDAGLRIRVQRDLREKFLEVCRAQDKPAAQVLREFMREYVARYDAREADTDAGSESIAGRMSLLNARLMFFGCFTSRATTSSSHLWAGSLTYVAPFFPSFAARFSFIGEIPRAICARHSSRQRRATASE